MWPWQLKNVHKRSLLWVKLVAVSCSAHIILLFLLLFVYADSTRDLTFTINSRLLSQDLSVLLMESYKRPRVQKKGGQKVAFNGGVARGKSQKKAGIAKKTSAQKNVKKTAALQKNVGQKSAQKSKNTSVREAGNKQVKVSQAAQSVKTVAPVAKKPSVQTSVVEAKKQVQVQKKAPTQKKIELNKKVGGALQKKDSGQKSAKKNGPIKSKIEKVVTHKPNIEKKTPQKVSDKKEAEKKSIKPDVRPDTTPPVQAALAQPVIEAQLQNVPADLAQSTLSGIVPTTNAVADLVEDQELAIAIDGQEYDTESLLRYAALQQEFARCWQPPVGVGESCVCDIKVYVAADGSITDMQMVTSSGVLMYDVAARSALSAMKLPKWTRNKYMTITFK